jgi:dTDP-4-dehydrorhamnose 3,5-epimerase
MAPSAPDNVRLLPGDSFADARGRFATPWESRHTPFFVPESAHFSHNAAPGTLRGLHYQAEPYAQSKLVHCVSGRVFDVTIDLRPESPGFKTWRAFELSAERPEALWIPAGFAHGFLTLEGGTILGYLIAGAYRPDQARGIRWDDPTFQIEWPVTPALLISDKDRSFPDFQA